MMKRVTAAAFALSLLGGASALAQQGPYDGGQRGAGGGEHEGGGHGGGGGQHGGGGTGGAAGVTGVSGGGGGQHGGSSGTAGPQGGGGGGEHGGGQHGGPSGMARPQGGGGGGQHGGPGGPNGFQGGGQAGGPGGYAGPQGGPGGDWRGGDRDFHRDHGGFNPRFGAPGFEPGGRRPHYDQRFFPRSFFSEHRHHWRGDWRAPRGFYYRHWGYGDRLPWGWFDRSFWIDDYYFYDLPVPPYGYEWVRLGPDAVLVDLASGMVVETVYGAFY